MKTYKAVITFIFTLLLSALSLPAMAYVGPGAGLSAIGSFLALLAGVIVALFGFVWFPLKRFLGRKKQQDDEIIEDDVDEPAPKQDT